MDIQGIIRGAMGEHGVTYSAMAARIGMTASAVGNALGATQRSMGVEKAILMLGALGYDLVAVPRGSRLPSGSVVVGSRSDGE